MFNKRVVSRLIAIAFLAVVTGVGSVGANTPPAAPTGLRVGLVDYHSVQLFWTDNSSDEGGFNINRCTIVDDDCWSSEIFAAGPDATFFYDTALDASTTYEYSVWAFNGAGVSTPAVVRVTTDPLPPPPPPPTNLVATTISTTQVDLNWTSSGGEQYIEIYVCPRQIEESCFSQNPLAIADSIPTNFSVNGLAPGELHYFRLAAVNASGRNGYSNTAEATTPPAPPRPPQYLSATTVSVDRIDLEWRDDASNETGFQIERCTGLGCSDYLQIETAGAAAGIGTISRYINSGLRPNTTYQYRIRAFNGEGSSTYTSAVAKTPEAPPAVPSNLTTALFRNSQVDVTWTDNSNNEMDFHVERCEGTASLCAAFTIIVPANGTSHRDSTVQRRTTYTYRVRARHQTDGHSAWSNTSTVTVK